VNSPEFLTQGFPAKSTTSHWTADLNSRDGKNSETSGRKLRCPCFLLFKTRVVTKSGNPETRRLTTIRQEGDVRHTSSATSADAWFFVGQLAPIAPGSMLQQFPLRRILPSLSKSPI
jgi:hypothetical protein